MRPLPPGFVFYVFIDAEGRGDQTEDVPCVVLPREFAYLGQDDVIRLNDDGYVRVLFRASSPHNSILVTEQCNHYCLMCSQPPKNVDDSWILREVRQLLPLIPRRTKQIGFTGGEPTLFGDEFLDILRLAKACLPQTSIHVLSNGRRFADPRFAQHFAEIDHHDLMLGIPVYSDDPARHDYVVQTQGAFDETIRGILNLKRLRQKIELRVVLHKQTIERLPKLAVFIARNLLFVDQVALMGLEITGFTRANFDSLWVDPGDYRDVLSEAVGILDAYGIRCAVYNHPLCLVNKDVEHAYVKSISDWKNEYAPECAPCTRKSECGGFFTSGIKHAYSNQLRPFF
ncbi:His-Xaa-Ser system radical SAM maturase HxsC [Acidithiobacillus sp.]|uniref:His-Xaa-Ser system radical SAM maturase HxsC n=1 Tax=Acidithiobacillus sp. TaxID=1872118 RepID=UPI003D0227CE